MDLVEIRKKAKSRKKKSEKGSKVKEKAPKKKAGRAPGSAETDAPEAAAPPSAQQEAAAAPAREPAPPEPAEVPAELPDQEPSDSLDNLKQVLQSQHHERREEDEEEQLQLLTFMLGGEEYALNIMDIKEIIRPKDTTEVPKAPDYVMGIISLRGTIVPIFNVNRRLGLKESGAAAQNRVVVVKWQEHLFGLLVDAVVQVLDLPISKIEPPPEVVGSVEGEFIRGVGRLEDRLVILLNMSRILAMDDMAEGEELELPGERGHHRDDER